MIFDEVDSTVIKSASDRLDGLGCVADATTKKSILRRHRDLMFNLAFHAEVQMHQIACRR